MADVSSLVEAVENRAAALFENAVDGMKERLQSIVPVGDPDPLGRPRVGPRLIDTFYKQPTVRSGTTLSVEIGYSAPQAAYSNYLIEPHVRPIVPRGKGYPLRFWWENGPQGPGEYRYMSVNHPGNINSRSLGWWDKTVDAVSWSLELDAATALVAS
jgi:hypothetical protein